MTASNKTMSFTFDLVNKVAELRAELAAERAKNADLVSGIEWAREVLAAEQLKSCELSERVAQLQTELEEVVTSLQKECDHEWKHEDDSFDHEFGTEQLHSSVCEKCGARKPYEP